jgi:hypothetical protein
MLPTGYRQRQAVLFHSLDDGYTWGGPISVDQEQLDTSEPVIAEYPDGRLQMLARPAKAAAMWTSLSNDRGRTWTPPEPTGYTGTYPVVLNHSSGAVLMGSARELRVSVDGGKTWSPTHDIGVTGMMGVAELPDGRILMVYHTGYFVPGRIRAQLLRITPEGLEPAW